MRPPHLATTAAAVLVVLALAGSVLLLAAGTGAGTSPSGGPVPLPAALWVPETVRTARDLLANDPNTIRRRGRLGGLLHEHQQVA